MAASKLKTPDFDAFTPLSERDMRKHAIADDDAFAAAMTRAIKRGREKATPGTFVDRSAPIGVRRIYGEVVVSSCGSPAAMCVDSARHGGAVEMGK